MFVGIEAETKLVPSFVVGKRDFTTAHFFMLDLASRMAGRIQLTTDGFVPYAPAVERAFGANVDYAQLVKLYGAEVIAEARHSPPADHGCYSDTHFRQSRFEADLYILRGASKPHHADADSSPHTV